jgi:hypothetical protein
MNKNFYTINLLIAGLVFVIFAAVCPSDPAMAQTTGTTAVKTPAVSIATLISRADSEINQRVQSLNDLLSRIGLMKKISNDKKNNLTSSVQNEITELTALKAKIDADTSLPTAKTDYQSITKSYRIYLLVLPQTRLVAASDRVLTIVDAMNAVGVKIQLRISALTGTNVAAINQIFSDFTAKIADASAQANAAVSEVSGLLPDQGNTATMQANIAALKDARAKIKTATADLVSARKDMGTIVQDLREMGGTNNSSAPAGQ